MDDDDYTTAKAAPRPTVAGQLDSLNAKANRLADLAAKLRERLSPILRGSDPSPEPPSSEKARDAVSTNGGSPLRASADGVHAVLDLLEARLVDIGDRAEV